VPHFYALAGGDPLRILNFSSPETRRIVLPDAEYLIIVSLLIWTNHRNVTDRQTDRYPLLQRSALRAMRTRYKNRGAPMTDKCRLKIGYSSDSPL